MNLNHVTLMKKQACFKYTDLQNSRTLARYCAKFLIMNTSKMFPRLRQLRIPTTSNNNQSQADLVLADYYYNTFYQYCIHYEMVHPIVHLASIILVIATDQNCVHPKLLSTIQIIEVAADIKLLLHMYY